jgi:peptide/nickel transport system substrate-binding protein
MFFEKKICAAVTKHHRLGQNWQNQMFGLLVVIFLLAGSFAGCLDEDDDDDNDTILVGVNALPETLDPAMAYDAVSLFVAGNVYETLVVYDEDSVYDVEPGVASNWEIDDTYKTFTFYLRGNLKFANGNPLTAEDVEFSLKRAITMGEEPSWLLAQIIDTNNITTGNYNPGTDSVEDIRITLKYPYRSFLNILAFPVASIVDKETMEIQGDNWLQTNTMGSGPFRVTGQKTGEMTLEKNKNYRMGWESKFVSKVKLKVMQSEAEKMEMLDDRKIDVAPISLASFKEADLMESVTTPEIESLRIGFIGFNTVAAPFDNLEVRTAFSMLLDYQTMANDILKHHGNREGSLFPSEFEIPLTRTLPSYNVVKALDILEENYTVVDGQVTNFPEITATYPTGNYLLENILTLYQTNLGDIGIILTLNPLNSTEYLSELKRGNTQLFGMEWEPDYADPDAYAQPLLHSSSVGTTNFAFYQNDTLDEMVVEAKKTFNPSQRTQKYGDIAGITLDEMPYLWLYNAKNVYASRNYVVGLSYNPIIMMNLYGVTLVK